MAGERKRATIRPPETLRFSQGMMSIFKKAVDFKFPFLPDAQTTREPHGYGTERQQRRSEKTKFIV
jgi:hypothetical protein